MTGELRWCRVRAGTLLFEAGDKVLVRMGDWTDAAWEIIDLKRGGRSVPLVPMASISPSKLYQPRGFAAMTKEKHLALCAKGGASVAASGRGHRFTHEQAVAAGRLGAAKRKELLKKARETTQP